MILYKKQLAGSHHIKGLSQGFEAEGGDPFLVFEHQPFQKGWYKLRILQQGNRAQFSTKLYPDYGMGFSEDDSLEVLLEANSFGRTLVYFPKDVKQLRYDPVEHSGHFDLKHFDLKHFELKKQPTLKVYASLCKRILRRVLRHPKKLQSIFSELGVYFNRNSGHVYDRRKVPLSITTHEGSGPHSPQAYQHWIAKYEGDLKDEYDRARTDVATWSPSECPLFSIIMPVYNTEADLLNRAIETVREQIYPHWELCISDDASPEPHIRPLLEEWMEKDERIKVVFREENGHISANSNSALALVSGDYCVLMDHDDEIRPHSIYEVARVIREHPHARFIYSDEDKVDREGNRNAPHFKSSWNPDLFYAQNYLNHLTVLEAARLREIGGWRIGYEGSQDHDLYLRFLHGMPRNQIRHIPKVLYHWRAIEGSAAMGIGEKSYALEAGLQCVQDYLTTHFPGATASHLEAIPHYRVQWPLPETPPLVSLIIPTKDMAEMTDQCVQSILDKTNYPNYEILIISNNSEQEESFAYFEEIQQKEKRVRVIEYNEPFNYSAINNFAVSQAKGEVVGLVNNDIEIINQGWLTEMVSHALRPEIGCVGAKLYYPNDTIQHAGVILGIGGVAGHSHKYHKKTTPGYFSRLKVHQNLSAVTAALLVVERHVFEEVNGLNEIDLKVAFNDVDFCLKVMNKGYHNLWTPYAEAYHHESISRGAEDNPVKIARFQSEINYMRDTWADTLDHDPYYSPNLTKDREDFSINI